MAEGGDRSAMIFFDMKDSADIPGIVEPQFASVNAKLELVPVMKAEDLRRVEVRDGNSSASALPTVQVRGVGFGRRSCFSMPKRRNCVARIRLEG